MDNNYSHSKVYEIDIIDLIWKLLMQWKAILLVCIITALLIPSVKYYKDSNEYRAKLSDYKKATEMSSKPVEEQIGIALKSLPSDQAENVLFLVRQQEMVNMQREYLNSSILLNTDPASQRHLYIKYLLKSDSGTDMRTLAEAYSTCLRRKSSLTEVRDIIAPDSKLEYINEIIDTTPPIDISDDAESCIYTIVFSLPNATDSKKIIEFTEKTIDSCFDEVSSNVGSHSIYNVDTEEYSEFNQIIIDRRMAITNSINDLTGKIEAAKKQLSPEQLAAFDTIISAMKASQAAENAQTNAAEVSAVPQPPVFNKKYALLGFLLGAVLYAIVYVVVLICRKDVASASMAQHYTGTRLLGEIYFLSDHKGFMKLFSSEMVARLIYKDKLDEDKQIDRLSATVDAVCSHNKTEKFTLLLSGTDHMSDDRIRKIAKRCAIVGDKKELILLNTDEADERSLESVENAAYVVCNDSNADNLGNLISLIREYEIKSLGTIYLEKL